MAMNVRSLCLLASLLFGWLLIMPTAQAQEELPLGSSMPEASHPLISTDGSEQTLASLQGAEGTLVIFWSNQCPWVDRYEDRVLGLQERAQANDIALVFINSNDASAFPDESREANRERARARGYSAPYVKDPQGVVARAFGASRTPHVFLFDAEGSLVYRGAIDDSPGDPESVQEQYLLEALEAVTTGDTPATSSTRAFGCTIKL